MPLDDTWWDPAGPFADNAQGLITAATMRDFAREIAEQGITADWFNIMFEPVAITPADWTSVDDAKVLWLTKTDPFDHSVNWEYSTDTATRDCFTYLANDSVTVQITFQPQLIEVSNATIGTAVTPVASLTFDKGVEPNDANTYDIGPTTNITEDAQSVSLGGWAVIIMADTERCLRFGVKFDPPPGGKVDDGGLNFGVDPTGLGASVVTRPLAPAA